MKPATFTYHRPATVPEALATLAEVGHDGKVLAGGQSLVPLLNMRLAAPAHLVDVNWLAELDEVATDAAAVRVGSLVHADPAAELPAVLVLLGGTMELAAAGELPDEWLEARVGGQRSATTPTFEDIEAGTLAEIVRTHDVTTAT